MASLEDLKEVLLSIDTSMREQTELLRNTVKLEKETLENKKRDDQLSKVSGDKKGGIISGAKRISETLGNVAGGASSLMGGLGSLAGGLGKGLGFAAGGVGVALMGLSSVLSELPDGQDIKDNVETLLSIGEGYENRFDFFLEGGVLASVLTGLGIGLAAFALGSGLQIAVQGAVEKFEMEGWATKIKNNVNELLSIADDKKLGSLELLYDGAGVSAALGGLGVGLAFFSVGQGVQNAVEYFSKEGWATNVKENVNELLSIADDKTLGGLQVLYEGVGVSAALAGLGAGLAAFALGQGVQNAVDYFSDNEWASKVKNNVETLLSISDIQGIGWDTTSFIGTMGGLASGLALFALGKGANTAVDGMDAALRYFAGDEPFADRIYNQVEKLLSISSIEGIGSDTGSFIGTMSGLALGLTAFALGKGANTIVDGMDDALRYFTGDEPFADRIYNQVEKLISMTDLLEGDGDGTKAGRFALGMGRISAGLLAFTASDLVGQLASASQEILGFFGAESPFEKVMDVAENSEQLIKGANAIERIAQSINAFSNISSGSFDIDFEEMAKNLGQAIPLFDKLANGGVYDPWGFGKKIDFGNGILDPSIRIGEIADKISQLRSALSLDLSMEAGQATAISMATERNNLLSQRLERIENAVIEQQSGQPVLLNYSPNIAPSIQQSVQGGTVSTQNSVFGGGSGSLNFGLPGAAQ